MACSVFLLSPPQNKGNHFLFQVTRLKRKPQYLPSWLDVQAAFLFPYSCDDLLCLGIFGFSEYCNNGQILLQPNFLFRSCILTELSCFLFTSCEGKLEGKRSGEIARGTNLISDCRGKSVEESELKDTDDLLQSSVLTREYSCHKREEKIEIYIYIHCTKFQW